jgi:ATP-dependent DNA helicase RecG
MRQCTDAAVESVTVTLFDAKRTGAWDEVSDWIDRHGAIANADVVRIAGVDTLKASRMLVAWRDQGLLLALPGRAKRNMAYTKPGAADSPLSLLSPIADNNPSDDENNK